MASAAGSPLFDYSPGEEIAHIWSALAGVAAAIIYTALLIPRLFDGSEVFGAVGAMIFAITVLSSYLLSVLYHAARPGPLRGCLRLLDHVAIFFLIAGTYTPFAIGPLKGHGGWWLAGAEWILALAGVAFKVSGGIKFRLISNFIYLGMGWLGLFWFRPFVQQMGWAGFGWVLAGGVFYTVGVAFYTAKQHRFTHFIWHLFVLAGTCSHGVAVWRYVA